MKYLKEEEGKMTLIAFLLIASFSIIFLLNQPKGVQQRLPVRIKDVDPFERRHRK